MDSRYHDIDDPAIGTCEWLFRHDTYKRWALCDRDLLWIKGKPGAGKSTILKYAVDNFGAKHSDLVLSLFFHNRGDTLQWSPLGLFRRMLHQILRLAPNALPDLVDVFREKREERGPPGISWEWHREELWSHLKSSLRRILEVHSIWLFVDALDECGEKQALYLVDRFRALLQGLPSTGQKFHICFSSRHYPVLDPYCRFEICLENENREDITTYVNERLSTLPTLSALVTKQASGVFWWAHDVVQRVLDLDRDGASQGMIKAEIESIPPDLSKLYEELIQDMGSRSVKLMQWICFATRPLSLDELRWALLIDGDCPQKSLRAYLESPSYISGSSRMKRQIQTLSRGLAEVIFPALDGNEHISDTSVSSSSLTMAKEPIVQFIHPSVKDFLVRGGLLTFSRNSPSLDAAIGLAHHQLSKICLRYLGMEEIGQSRTYDRRDFPFLSYATISWLSHMRESSSRGVVQQDLGKLFSRSPNSFAHIWWAFTAIFIILKHSQQPAGTQYRNRLVFGEAQGYFTEARSS